MLDFEKAIQLTGNERKAEIESRLKDYLDSDLLNLCREANSWDGSFDFVDAFDIEDLCDMVDNKYELVRSVIYGDVTNVMDMVRYNAYGNLESVSEYDLCKEANDYICYLADWLMDDWDKVDGLYEEDEQLFDAWDDIDAGRYSVEDYLSEE